MAKMRLKLAKRSPKMAKMMPKMTKMRPKMTKMRPKMAKMRPNMRPRWALERSQIQPSSIEAQKGSGRVNLKCRKWPFCMGGPSFFDLCQGGARYPIARVKMAPICISD